MAISILDTEIAALWDADHRSAAWASFVAGALGAVVAALALSTLGGTETSQFEGVLTAGVMVLVDIALLVFMVGLAYAVAGGTFGVTVTVAVATLTTTIAATVHTVFGMTAVAADLPDWAEEFVGWTTGNLWILPQYALPIGACLVALSLALRASEFRFARGLARPYLGVGAGLGVLAPFSGAGDPMSGGMWLSVLVTLAVCVAVPVLFVITEVKLGRLLWATRTPHHSEPSPSLA